MNAGRNFTSPIALKGESFAFDQGDDSHEKQHDSQQEAYLVPDCIPREVIYRILVPFTKNVHNQYDPCGESVP